MGAYNTITEALNAPSGLPSSQNQTRRFKLREQVLCTVHHLATISTIWLISVMCRCFFVAGTRMNIAKYKQDLEETVKVLSFSTTIIKSIQARQQWRCFEALNVLETSLERRGDTPHPTWVKFRLEAVISAKVASTVYWIMDLNSYVNERFWFFTLT